MLTSGIIKASTKYLLKQIFLHDLVKKAVFLTPVIILKVMTALHLVGGVLAKVVLFLHDRSLLLGGVFFCIVVDHFTGISAAKTRGERLYGAGRKILPLKILIYFGSVLVLLLIPMMMHTRYVAETMDFIVDVAMALYIINELISIDRNASWIFKAGKPSALGSVLHWVKSKITDKTNGKINGTDRS